MKSYHFSRRQFMKVMAAVAVSSLGNPVSALSQISSNPLTLESRAIFDEGLNWWSVAGAEKVLQRIKKAGFNVFMPCVWHGRGTIWPSNLAPWDSANTQVPGYDPLANLMTQAAKYEIEIHPWFTVSLRQRWFLTSYFNSMTPWGYFDVHNPAFRQFISSLMMEVVSRYRVHGVNLDFIRAGGVPTSSRYVTEYRTLTGRDLIADAKLATLPGVDLNQLKELIGWQEAAVRDIVLRVSRQARQVNPNIVISVDATPGNPLVTIQGQNSMKWADEGLVDVIYSMDYSANPDYTKVRNFQSSMKRPEAMVLFGGNFDRTPEGVVVPRAGSKVAEILTQARSIGYENGVGLYLYSMLSDEQINVLSSTVFASSAKPHWARYVA